MISPMSKFTLAKRDRQSLKIFCVVKTIGEIQVLFCPKNLALSPIVLTITHSKQGSFVHDSLTLQGLVVQKRVGLTLDYFKYSNQTFQLLACEVEHVFFFFFSGHKNFCF